MAYTYYTVAKSSEPATPKDYWRKTTQKLNEKQLKNSSSYLQVEKYNPATGLYVAKDARVVKISTAKPSGQSSTATNNTDDYREIIFLVAPFIILSAGTLASMNLNEWIARHSQQTRNAVDQHDAMHAQDAAVRDAIQDEIIETPGIA